MSWTFWLVLLLAVLLVASGVAVYFYLRKKAPGASGATSAEGQPVDLVAPYRVVKKDLSPAQRFGPGVLAWGDAGWKASRVLERLSGGSPGIPAGEGAQLRIYRGKDAVVLELSDDLVQNESSAVLSALARLSRELPGGVVLLCLAVDYRSLLSGALPQGVSWAQVLQKRLPLLAAAGRSVGVRLCVTGLETEPGYSVLRSLWLSRRSTALGFLEIEQRAELRRFFDQLGAELGVVLSASPREFESVARLALALPDALATLRELTVPLHETLARYTQSALNGVYLTDASGAAIPQRPFAFRQADVAESRARQERALVFREARRVAVGCCALLLSFLVCWGWVSRVSDEVRIYAESSGPQPGGTAAPVETSERGARAADGLAKTRFWPLPYAFSPQRREQERSFVEATRSFYVAPALEPERSLMRRALAACLDRAHSDNDFGELILAHRPVFEETLAIPSQSLSEVVRLGSVEETRAAIPSLTQAAGSLTAWRSLVLSIASATEEGVFEPRKFEELRDAAFLTELPRDAASVRVLQRAVGLLAAHADSARGEEARAAQQIDAELEFLVENLSSLSVLRDWFQRAPSLGDLREPKTLAQLLELTIARPAGAPAAAEGPSSITVRLDPPVTIERARFEQALTRTRASVLIEGFVRSRRQGGYVSPYESACGGARSSDPAGSSFFPTLAIAWGEGQEKAQSLDPLDGLAVSGPVSRGYGPTATLPGWFTREALQRFVSPVVAATLSEVDTSVVTPDDLFSLRNFIDEELAAYADDYGLELSCYFQSFRFKPASLPLAESAVRELAAEGSWFERFLSVVAEQATLPAPTNPALTGAVAGFAPLVKAVSGKALKDYFTLLAAALPPTAAASAGAPTAAGSSATAPGSTKGGTSKIMLGRDDRLDDALAVLQSTSTSFPGILGWLETQGIAGSYQRPFLAPWESLRGVAVYELQARWQRELVAPATSLLRKYPFRSAASASGGTATVSELEAEFGVDGRFWSVVRGSFSTLVEAQPSRDATARNQWMARAGLHAPSGMIELLQAAERLTTALWSSDGKQNELKLRITPHALPLSRRGEPVIALAYLTLSGADMQSFNQALEARTLAVEWWSQGESMLSVELLDRYASEVEEFSTIANRRGAWSFLQLLDVGRVEEGVLTFYLQGDSPQGAKVEFALQNDPRALFTAVAAAADQAREEKK